MAIDIALLSHVPHFKKNETNPWTGSPLPHTSRRSAFVIPGNDPESHTKPRVTATKDAKAWVRKPPLIARKFPYIQRML